MMPIMFFYYRLTISSCNGYAVRDCIRNAGFCKSLQPQPATIAHPAGRVFVLVAGPRKFKWRAQFHPLADNGALLHSNHRSHHRDLRLRPRSYVRQLLKNAVVLGTTVRIARTVFRDRADKDGARANHFRPAHRHGEKMSIAKGHVGHRNGVSHYRRVRFTLRNLYTVIGERRAADLLQVIELHHQPLANPEKISNGLECCSFPPLRTLAVARVQERYFMGRSGDGRGYARVHPAADQNYTLGFRCHANLPRSSNPTCRGMPDEFVELQTEPHRQAVR